MRKSKNIAQLRLFKAVVWGLLFGAVLALGVKLADGSVSTGFRGIDIALGVGAIVAGAIGILGGAIYAVEVWSDPEDEWTE